MFGVLFVLLFATIATKSNGSTDLTRVPDAYGREVAMACMQLIEKSGTFSDDYNLMRRIAWVESQYGENAFTYVPGSSFHGGIWGINEASFNATKTSELVASQAIQQSFQIDWSLVVWEDLRKPLYSALAARIYLDVMVLASNDLLLNSTVDQLALWKSLNGERRRNSDFTAFNDYGNNFFKDFEEINIGQDIQQELESSVFLQANVANIEEVEIEFRVISGNATLYVSNSVSTSSSVHCGTTTGGRIFMKPAQLFPYEGPDTLYMYVDGTIGSVFQLTVSKPHENVTFGSESSEFVIGMYSNHPDTGSLPITVLVTSNENEAFELTIENITGPFMNVTINAKQTEIILPHMYVVSGESETQKGIFLRTNKERKISVSVINNSPTMHSTDSYHALPVIKYAGLDEYVYYGITPNTNITGLKNRILLIGNQDHTSVTITPTQHVTIMNEAITPNEAYTVELNRLETLLIQSQQPLTGTKVVSNKPITFLSGHQCAVVPESGNSCDFAIEQIPPTVTWGKRFMFQMLSSRTGGSHFTVLTSENNTNVSLWCTLPSSNQSLQSHFTLEEAGDYKMLEIAPDDVICSLSTSKPSALVLFGTSENADEGSGDPLLMMIPPVEQFSSTYMFKSRENFNKTFINILVMGNHNSVLKDGVPFSSTWNEIKDPSEGIDTFGFATKLPVEDFVMHNITTNDANTNISVLMYGLDFSVGYGQRVGTMLKPISSPFEYNAQPTINGATASQQLTCLTGGIPAYAFTWEKDGHGLISPSYKYSIASSGYTDNVLTITQPTSEDSGVYTCTFYTYYNGFASTSITTTLNVIDTAVSQPSVPMLSSLKEEYGNVESESTTIDADLTNGMLVNSTLWRFENLNGIIMDISTSTDKYSLSMEELSLEVLNLTFYDRGIISLAVRTEDGTAELKVMLNLYVEVALLSNYRVEYEIDSGDSITFNCIGDGINAPVFHWTKNQELLLSSAKYIIHSTSDMNGFRNIQSIKGTNTSLTIPAVDSNDGAVYACVANNEAQNASTRHFDLIVRVTEINYCSPDPCSNGQCDNLQNGYLCICEEGYTGKNCDKVVQVFIPPSIITAPSDLKVDLYNQGRLVCASSGVPTPITNWYKDGEPILNTNADQSEFVFLSTDLDNRGIYYCEVNSTYNGRLYSERSEPVIVNINNVVQYEGYLEINSSFTDVASLIEQINNELLGTEVNGSSFFVLQENTKGETIENQIPVLLTMLTAETKANTKTLLDAISNHIKRISQSLEVLVIDLIVDPAGDRFDGCEANSTILNNIAIEWAETNIGDTAYTICPCGNTSSESNLYATRYCGGDFQSGGVWEAGNVAVCNFSRLARDLCELADLEVPERLQRLDTLTNNATLDSTAVTVSVLVLIGTSENVLGNETLTSTFLDVVNNILTTDESTMLTSTRMSNTSARLQAVILSVADQLPLDDGENSSTLVRSTFAVSVQRIDFSNFNGLNYSVNATENLSEYGVQYANVPNTTSSITLPSNLFGTLTSNSNRSRISNSVFLNKNAFLVEDMGSYDVGSLIMSARVVGINRDNFQNLTPPVSMRFESLVNGTNPICVFFDTKANSGSGSWSSEGCYSVRPQNGMTVQCQCDHLTSFTILLDVSPTASENKYSHSGHALTAVTYIGLCISIICLIVTIVSYLSIKRLRDSETGKLIINLCIALIGLYITFIAAVHSKDSIGMCSFVGAILHYFFLVTFLAMAIQAVDLYIKLVIVLGRRINYFVIKGVIVCWVAPLPIVVLSFVPNYKNYASEHFCRAFGVPYYVGMITPFLVIYLFNWTVFVLTFVSITRQALQKRKVEENTKLFNLAFIKREFISAVILSSLLGVGWGIGLFASNDIHSNAASRDAVSALFVLLTAFHGVLIFVMHSIRSKDIRLLWKKGFFKVTRQEFTQSTTGTLESSRKRNQRKKKAKKGLEMYSKNMESRTVDTSHVYDTVEDPADATLRYHVINHKRKETEFLSDYAEVENEEKVDLSALPKDYEMAVDFIYEEMDEHAMKSDEEKETP